MTYNYTPPGVDVGTQDIAGENKGVLGSDTDAPNIYRPGNFTAEHAAGPLSAAAGRAEAQTRETQPNELPSTHLSNWLNKDSVFNQRAKKHGEMYANSRGLLNTSVAAGASMGAVMDRLEPFALGDAQSYLSTAQANQQAQNQVNLQNAQQETQANIANANRFLAAGQSNQATQSQVYSTEISSILERGRHDLVWAQTQLDASLREFETNARLAGIKYEAMANLSQTFLVGAATIFAETEDRGVAQSKVAGFQKSVIAAWNGVGNLRISPGTSIAPSLTVGGITPTTTTAGGGTSGGGGTSRGSYDSRISAAYESWNQLQHGNPSGYNIMNQKYIKDEDEEGYTLYDRIAEALEKEDWNTVERILADVEADIILYQFGAAVDHSVSNSGPVTGNRGSADADEAERGDGHD